MYEAQEYCVGLGGCLVGNNSSLADLNHAIYSQTRGPAHWIGTRKLGGLRLVWLNGENLSVTPSIEDPSSTCAHV
ncbi:hypothetical protein DPMN_032190 [Dreissena polymorpha]|uniref:C-type lectin domain-containing protein n=1 Tax=Dreissena polymorpha TaxID=45954 RepID=A0A9D4M485_DREPO|nr:hypothetical protein DPMN_032190 [Dreissena polymorpha]